MKFNLSWLTQDNFRTTEFFPGTELLTSLGTHIKTYSIMDDEVLLYVI